MKTYKIQWKHRGQQAVALFASLSAQENEALSDSIKKIREYIDFPRVKIEEVDAQTLTEPALTAAEVRKQLALHIGVSQLP